MWLTVLLLATLFQQDPTSHLKNC